MRRATRRWTGAVAPALVSIALVSIAAATPAHAAAYRYWTYWQAAPGESTWTFSTQGAGTSVPADGSVQGWAFGITTQSGSPDDAPGQAPDFGAVCGDTPAVADSKRVALVIDSGSPEIAPDGESPPPPVATCVVVAADASGYDVLRSVADVRTDNGLICSLAGYPARECAPVLSDADASALSEAASAAPASAPATESSGSIEASGMDAADAQPSSAGSPVATIAVAALLIVGAGVGVAVSRRRGVPHG